MLGRIRSAAVAAVAIGSFVAGAQAQASLGDLDPGFGDAGKVQLEGSGGGWSFGSGTQTDGRLVFGRTLMPSDGSSSVVIERLELDGSIDESFGIGGAIEIADPEHRYWSYRFQVDSQDRILVSISDDGPGAGDTTLGLRRFLPDGAVDASFGVNGVVDLSAARSSYLFATDSHDRVLTGYARLKEDGSLDTTYGESGFAALLDQPAASDAYLVDVAARSDDSPLITALDLTQTGKGGSIFNMFVEAIGPDGDPLDSFGTDGLQLAGAGQMFASTPGPDGTTYFSVNDNVHRLDSSGSPDAAFLAPDLGLISIQDLAVDGQGRLLVLGRGAPDGGYHPTAVILRILSSGKLDASFGESGKAFIYGEGPRSIDGRSLGLAPDGSIYGVGNGDLWRTEVGDGPDDLDADGLSDPADRCPWLPASGDRSGCPVIRPTASRLARKQGYAPALGILHGRINAKEPACYAGVHVKVFRTVDGTRSLYGTAETTSVGRWRVLGKLRPGVYVAQVKRHDEGPHGRCLRTVSPEFAVGGQPARAE